MGVLRFDIVSDTHGHLSDELLHALEGADYIMHAGDCCNYNDFQVLSNIAPMSMCLGNNDWGMDYGPDVQRITRVYRAGQRWQLCHYEERLDLMTADIAVCGHSHRPFIRWEKSPGGTGKVLVINPGSPTFPRTAQGPTIGRIILDDNHIASAEIIELDESRASDDKSNDGWGFARFFRR